MGRDAVADVGGDLGLKRCHFGWKIGLHDDDFDVLDPSAHIIDRPPYGRRDAVDEPLTHGH